MEDLISRRRNYRGLTTKENVYLRKRKKKYSFFYTMSGHRVARIIIQRLAILILDSLHAKSRGEVVIYTRAMVQ